MGSTLQSDRDINAELNKKTYCGNKNVWKMSGVIWDRRIPSYVNENIHTMIVQPAMLYGMERVTMTSSHVTKLEVTEMKTCR